MLIICKILYIIVKKCKIVIINFTVFVDISDANLKYCFVLFPGAEDVVMAFSRSETEDRRQ